MKRLSFLFHPDAQRILNNFTSLFQIRIAFFTPDGEELRVGRDQGLCRYCRLVRAQPGGEEACLDQDKKGRIRARDAQDLVVYTCHAGMTEAVKPLVEEGNLIGYIMMGQIRSGEEAPPRWKKGCGDAYREQTFRRQSELRGIMELFSDLVDLIMARRLIEKKGGGRLTGLTRWIREHIDGSLTLREAADHLHLSPSRLSHLVKEEYGQPYTVLLRDIRMEQARFLLSHYPEKSIKETALSVGYGDQRYFSRVFKQVSGVTPEAYRRAP